MSLLPSTSSHNPSPALRAQFIASVLHNVALCREHYRLVLLLDAFPPTEPGQFIQIQCRDPDRDYEPNREWTWQPGLRIDPQRDELANPLALLRRPFSLAGRRDTDRGVELEIIHRIVGIGTDWLSQLHAGDRVDILGPLGNRFTLPPANGTAILVGGGVGIPPMLYLAEKLAGQNAVAFCGALTRDLLPLTLIDSLSDGNNAQVEGQTASGKESASPALIVEEFARHGIPSVISTDDGTFGMRGFVTQALERFLDSLTPQHSALSTSTIYTCGPEPMMKRIADIASSRGIECQIAVERAMACGMGTCQSCCIRVRKTDPAQPPLPGSDWCWRLACTDGPVFRGSDLLW